MACRLVPAGRGDYRAGAAGLGVLAATITSHSAQDSITVPPIRVAVVSVPWLRQGMMGSLLTALGRGSERRQPSLRVALGVLCGGVRGVMAGAVAAVLVVDLALTGFECRDLVALPAGVLGL
jgi:hypothetical protein